MATTFRSVSTAATVASGDITLNLPTGNAAGDLLIAVISFRSSAAFTVPAGWTQIEQQNSGNVVVNGGTSTASGLMAYMIRGASAPTALTFTRTAGDVAFGRIVAYQCDAELVLDTSISRTETTSNTTITVAGSLTTTEANEFIFFASMGGRNLNSGTAYSAEVATDPATFTERFESGTTTGADCNLMGCDASRATAGSTGTIQATNTGGNQPVGIAAAFKLAGAATQNITGALFTDGDTFYGATVTPGDVAITGALYTNANTVYAATITQPSGSQSITGALFSNANSFFGSTASATYGITGALFTDADTFFGSTVTASYAIAGGLFTDADTFFGASVSASYGVAGNLYSNVNTFFGATVSQSGDQAITGALYANDNSFFGSTVTGQSTARQIGGGGGFPLTDQHVRDLREATQRQRDHQDRTDAQKRRDAAELRKALERAWEDIKEEAPAVFVEAAPEVNFERKKVDWSPLVRDHDAVLRVLDDVKAKLAAISRESQRKAAEEQATILAAIELQRLADDDEAVALIFLAA